MLVCHQVSCSHHWHWLHWLGCRYSLVAGADMAGQLNVDRRSGWRWMEERRRCETPPTGHWEQSRGRLSPTWMKSDEEIFLVVFHLLFIWMPSLLLVCLLLWNSVISLILKFKYINFYLVYRYLFDFSVGESVYECVWECVMHVAYCMRTSGGHVVLKCGALGVLMGCGFFRNSRKNVDSFHWVSFGLCFCQSVSLLWSLAQYE